MKLLIVDDHRKTRDLIREMIGHLATEIRECASGEEAVARCGEFRPDLVTMDMQMQAMNGIEATQKLLARHPHACVIIVAQSDVAELRSVTARAGADHFVPKDDLVQLRRFAEQRLAELAWEATPLKPSSGSDGGGLNVI